MPVLLQQGAAFVKVLSRMLRAGSFTPIFFSFETASDYA
jgi:hypothetical protein